MTIHQSESEEAKAVLDTLYAALAVDNPAHREALIREITEWLKPPCFAADKAFHAAAIDLLKHLMEVRS